MRDLVHSTDMVLLDFARQLLSDAGVASFVADTHIGSALGTFAPHRLQVSDDDYEKAWQVLTDAGLGQEIVTSR